MESRGCSLGDGLWIRASSSATGAPCSTARLLPSLCWEERERQRQAAGEYWPSGSWANFLVGQSYEGWSFFPNTSII